MLEANRHSRTDHTAQVGRRQLSKVDWDQHGRSAARDTDDPARHDDQADHRRHRLEQPADDEQPRREQQRPLAPHLLGPLAREDGPEGPADAHGGHRKAPHGCAVAWECVGLGWVHDADVVPICAHNMIQIKGEMLGLMVRPTELNASKEVRITHS